MLPDQPGTTSEVKGRYKSRYRPAGHECAVLLKRLSSHEDADLLMSHQKIPITVLLVSSLTVIQDIWNWGSHNPSR